MDRDERHLEKVRQSVDEDDFDNKFMKGNLELPAIKLEMKYRCGSPIINILKNTVRFGEGEYNFYIRFGEKLIYLGKIKKDIDTIYKIQNIFRRYLEGIYCMENGSEGFKELDFKDLIYTIKL